MKNNKFKIVIACVLLTALFFIATYKPTSLNNSFSKLVLGDSIKSISSDTFDTYILQEHSSDLSNYFETADDEKAFIEAGSYHTACLVYSGSLLIDNKTYDIVLTVPQIVFSDGINILLTENFDFLNDGDITIFSDNDQYRLIVGRYSISAEENQASNILRVGDKYELSFHCDAVNINDSFDIVEIKHTIKSDMLP